jgi:hypothetical protein
MSLCCFVQQGVSSFSVFVCLSVKVDPLFSDALSCKVYSFWCVCLSVRQGGSMFLCCFVLQDVSPFGVFVGLSARPARWNSFWCGCVSVRQGGSMFLCCFVLRGVFPFGVFVCLSVKVDPLLVWLCVCPSRWIYVSLLLCPAKCILFGVCVCLSVKVDLCSSVALSCKCKSPFGVFVCLSAGPARCTSF